MMLSPDQKIQTFLDASLDITSFDHAAHLDMAQHLLGHHDFLEAVWIYDRAIKAIAARAGAPGKRSVTKTLAFMSLIAETGKKPDKHALDRWFSSERLNSDVAAQKFVMPDKYD